MRAPPLLYAASPSCSRSRVPLLGIYPVFMMKLLCFAMFACAFNLLLGFGAHAVVRARGLLRLRRLRRPAGW